MPGGKEQRRYPRIEANVYVDYTGEEILLFHRIENISLGGISIIAPSVEKVGTIVELAINFPDEEQVVECLGEVVWSREDEDGQMGIKFTNLEGESRQALKGFLAKNDPFYAEN